MSRKPGEAEKQRARILIVDDHELVRSGLRAMIESDARLELVAEAASGSAALDIARHEQLDLILMDVQMPEMDGLATARAIKEINPATRVIIVTMHANSEYLVEALRVGVAGYVLKDATRKELLSAVHQVLRGESFLNNALVLQTLRNLAAEPSAPPQTPVETLTGRELEVLRLLTQGKTNREIARDLVISAGTVKVHVEHIIAKLGASDRTQAAVRAVELGLTR